MTFRTIQQQAIDRITGGHVELTPEKRTELREWQIAIGKAASFLRFQSAYGEHSQIVKVEYSEVAERLAEVERQLPPILDAAAEENATLRAEVDDLREQVAKLREFVEATVCTCTSHPCRRCSLIAATAPKEAAK